MSFVAFVCDITRFVKAILFFVYVYQENIKRFKKVF